MSIELPQPSRTSGRRRYTLLTWVVSALSLVLLFVWIPVGDVWAALQAVDWKWLPVAAALTVVNLIVRGYRWARILGRRGPPAVSVSTYVCAIALGMNAIFPGRVGELARIGLAARHLKLRIGRIVAAAVAERLIDLVVLLILVALPLTYVIAPPGSQGSEFIAGLNRLARSLAWVCVLVAAGLVLLGHGGLNRRVRGLVFRLTVGSFPGLARHLHRSLNELRRALVYVAAPARLSWVLGLTLVMWLALGFGVVVAAWGSPQVEISLPVALAFAAVTVLAGSLPSAPGAWGVYEAAGVVFIVGVAGLADRAAVLAFVVVVHLIQYVPVVAAAGVSWILIHRQGRDAAGVRPLKRSAGPR